MSQILVEEDFDSYDDGPFLGGSTGQGFWDGGWQVDNSGRMEVVQNREDFSKSLAGLGSVSGGVKSLELRTSNGSSEAKRNFNPVDVPFYISFLFSIESVGTGGGSLDLSLLIGNTSSVIMRFIPDIDRAVGAFYFKGDSGAYRAIPLLPPKTAYLVVIKMQDPSIGSSAAIRFDPSATTTYSDSYAGATSGPPSYFSGVSFKIGRNTVSGSDSVFRIDEFKIGLTRADVAPDASDDELVQNFQLEMIPRISFYSESGKSYFIQRSFDLASWTQVTQITGNNSIKTWTDTTSGNKKAFYRIVPYP
jgi:hypothetical protein